MSDYNGNFVWYDLMSKDPAGAEAFYTKLIGWETETWDGPAEYKMFKAGGTTIGGLMQLPEEAEKAGAPSLWIAYVATSDLDASFEKMKSLGGDAKVPPTDIPTVGKFAIFTDPQGALIAMFQPNGDAPAPASGPGFISWHELLTSDLEAGLKFYEALFGWNKTQAMDMGPEMGTYQMYGRGERTFGGMMRRPPNVPVSCWLYYITVADIRQSLDNVQKLGGQVIHGPQEVPGGDLVAQCMDPQGAMFALHEHAGS